MIDEIMNLINPEISKRVKDLCDRYGGDEVWASELLCDSRESSKSAFLIVDHNLDVYDLTYGELRERSERFAAALFELEIRPGDRVATLMGKSREYLVALLGIWRLGAVHVPLFTAFAPPAINLRLTGSRAKVVVCDETQSAKLKTENVASENLPWRVVTTGQPSQGQLSFSEITDDQEAGFEGFVAHADHPIVQLYTSGTTGTPKGVIMPIKSLASFQAYMEFGLDIREDDIFWSAADPGWAYGMFTAIFGTLTTGCRSILLEGGFSPEKTYATLSKYGVTNFTAAPTVYRALKASEVDVPKDLKHEMCLVQLEPLTPDVNMGLLKTLGVQVHDHYGQTEMGMLINNHHYPALKKTIKDGSMGISLPGFKAKILKMDCDQLAKVGNEGRLAIDVEASPLAWFAGYADLPEKTSEKFSMNGTLSITWCYSEVGCGDGFVHFSSRETMFTILAGFSHWPPGRRICLSDSGSCERSRCGGGEVPRRGIGSVCCLKRI